MIGLAAWIRSFYFYPLLGSLTIGFVTFIFLSKKYKKISHVFILCALLFPAVQVRHTYKVSGEVAYMYTTSSNAWTDIHLNSNAVGYDTVLPSLPMYSKQQYCSINSGLLASLKERDYTSLLCLFFNRALFFLSTYKNVTYIDSYNPINKLLSNDIENIGKSSSWLANDINIQWDISKDPFGKNTADRMASNNDNDTYLVQWVALPANTLYTFSVWLWSEYPAKMEIAFSHHGTGSAITKKIVSITAEPQRFFVSGKTQDANDYSVSIGNMPFTNNTDAKPTMPPYFYAWGAQLEMGSSMTQYAGIEEPDPNVLRSKHLPLLIANILTILAALFFLVRNRQILLTHPARLVAVAVVVFSFAQALIIIPEQRFIIVPMIFIWLLAATQAASFVDAKLCRFQTPN